MRIAPLILSLSVSTALVIVACADTPEESGVITVTDAGKSSSSGDAKSSSGGGKDGSSCEKKTCETVDGACGSHDDGCGGTFSCGKCDEGTDACAPATCAKLGKTCGNHDNQCGGTVSCGKCEITCPADAKEPNDNPDAAADLGAASDYANAEIVVKDIQSFDGDEDWFKIATTDGGFGGNPLVTATVTDNLLEVAIFHVCKSQPDFSYCADEKKGTQENTIGKGCYAEATVQLSLECKGIDESGTTYVRVRKRGNDNTCHAYNLTVKVE